MDSDENTIDEENNEENEFKDHLDPAYETSPVRRWRRGSGTHA